VEQAQRADQPEPAVEASAATTHKKRPKGCLAACLVVLVLLAAAWFFFRPGVFTVQPIGALPEGVTFIYHSRNPRMPFFSSPDGLCLVLEGSVTLLCRGAALSAAGDLSDRIILRLPYSHWAYLRSTGGVEFEE
jgi:hypothetical protein